MTRVSPTAMSAVPCSNPRIIPSEPIVKLSGDPPSLIESSKICPVFAR